VIWEAVVIGVAVLGVGALLLRSVRRRTAFSRAVDPDALPRLMVQTQVTGKLRRVFREGETPLVEVAVGKRVLIFCPADHTTKADDWRLKTGQNVEVALYGLATLAPGGADSIKDQIKDADQVEITPDLLRFLHVGEQRNDYFAIGRVLSHRSETWDGDALTLYRLQAATDLTLEVGTAATTVPFEDGAMVHGSVRLFGYFSRSA
jgi:hypothetical protein